MLSSRPPIPGPPRGASPEQGRRPESSYHAQSTEQSPDQSTPLPGRYHQSTGTQSPFQSNGRQEGNEGAELVSVRSRFTCNVSFQIGRKIERALTVHPRVNMKGLSHYIAGNFMSHIIVIAYLCIPHHVGGSSV